MTSRLYFLLGYLSFLGFLSRAWKGLQLMLPHGTQGLAVDLAGHSQELLPSSMWGWQVLFSERQALLESFLAPTLAWGSCQHPGEHGMGALQEQHGLSRSCFPVCTVGLTVSVLTTRVRGEFVC